MRRLALVAFIVLLMSTLAYAKGYEVKGNAGHYGVEVKFDRNPPAKGSNHLDIIVSDTALKPVKDAAVAVKYLMPSFPGRPPMMEYQTTANREGETYKATLDLSMAGEWTFVINVTRGGKTEAMTFTLIVR